MKNTLIITAVTVCSISFASCGDTTKSTNTSTTSPSVAGESKSPAIGSQKDALNTLIDTYLQLKNGLADDDSQTSASAAVNMVTVFDKFNIETLSVEKRKEYQNLADDAKEMAEHIGKSAGKLDHQREHFDMLSNDMKDLVYLVGSQKHLYIDHCPMYNDKKGAMWLSEVKEIKNPYMGKNMATCGVIKEELK